MDRRSFLKSISTNTDAGAISAELTNSKHPISHPIEESSSRTSNFRNRFGIESTLAPWSPSTAQPWDVHTVNHLFRRGGFGATIGEIKAAIKKSPSEVVDSLLDESLLTRPTVPAIPSYSDSPNPPGWLHVPPYFYTDFPTLNKDYMNANLKIRSHWTVQMAQPEVMLREKMTLFWMNHFVIEAKKIHFPQMSYYFLTYMRRNAWGNFKQMVKDVTTMPGMLQYLDGVLNVGTAPNENYARELLELFMMGVLDKNGNPNYTQDDIEAVAHVLTGWTVDTGSPPPDVLQAMYAVNLHDSSLQKIFDSNKRQYNLAAANEPMDQDLIDHIFEKRGDQIAWFICSKLYQHFVYHEITTDAEKVIIQQLAEVFKVNWSIKEVLALLLKSEHFFDEANIGSQIKSPYEYQVGLLRSFNIPIDELSAGTLYFYAFASSQVLLDPPNVKGWPGYHNWISTATLPFRNSVIATQLFVTQHLAAEGADGYGNNHTSIDLWDFMVLQWGQQFANYSGTFDSLLAEIATYLCAHTPSLKALAYIKSKLPPNTYEWTALKDAEKISPLRSIAKEILLLADYQLF